MKFHPATLNVSILAALLATCAGVGIGCGDEPTAPSGRASRSEDIDAGKAADAAGLSSSGGGETAPSNVAWPNEPAGSTTLLDCNFDNPTCDGKLEDPYHSAANGAIHVEPDPSAPATPNSVLRTSLIYPSKTGGTQLGFTAPRAVRKIYVGLWWKPSAPFGGNVTGYNKLFFVRRLDGGTNGVFLWTYRVTDTLASNGDLGRLFWNTQIINTNTDRCGSEGLRCMPNAGADLRITPGNWYRLEAYFVASSSPSSYDGTVRWWVTKKGEAPVLLGDYPNFAYSAVSEWVWSETWDGFGNGTVPAGYTSDQHHYIDHLHISSTDCDGPACLGPGK